jgi:hypothetical protein
VRSPSLVGLYPRAWRDRYGDEMRALIEIAPLRRRDRADLMRGALDAWLHPPMPSRIPAVAALLGGGLWTVAAAGVVFQPAPPDWPGYLAEVVMLALVAAGILFMATLGCALRVGDLGGRAMAFAVALTVVGYFAWIAVLAATAGGLTGGATLAAAQTLAMIGTAVVGVVLVRAGDATIGLLIVTGAVAMLIPWPVTWLVFGAAWTAVGVVLAMERSRWPGPGWGVS